MSELDKYLRRQEYAKQDILNTAAVKAKLRDLAIKQSMQYDPGEIRDPYANSSQLKTALFPRTEKGKSTSSRLGHAKNIGLDLLSLPGRAGASAFQNQDVESGNYLQRMAETDSDNILKNIAIDPALPVGMAAEPYLAWRAAASPAYKYADEIGRYGSGAAQGGVEYADNGDLSAIPINMALSSLAPKKSTISGPNANVEFYTKEDIGKIPIGGNDKELRDAGRKLVDYDSNPPYPVNRELFKNEFSNNIDYYHGSPANGLSQINYVPRELGGDTYGRGIYFTSNPQLARSYSNPRNALFEPTMGLDINAYGNAYKGLDVNTLSNLANEPQQSKLGKIFTPNRKTIIQNSLNSGDINVKPFLNKGSVYKVEPGDVSNYANAKEAPIRPEFEKGDLSRENAIDQLTMELESKNATVLKQLEDLESEYARAFDDLYDRYYKGGIPIDALKAEESKIHEYYQKSGGTLSDQYNMYAEEASRTLDKLKDDDYADFLKREKRYKSNESQYQSQLIPTWFRESRAGLGIVPKWKTPEEFATNSGFPGYIPMNASDPELVRFSSEPMPISKEYRMQPEYFPENRDYKTGLGKLLSKEPLSESDLNEKNLQYYYKMMGLK